MPQQPPKIEAPFTLGAQIEARGAHPELRDRVFLCQDSKTWTMRVYRDECVRYAHFLLKRLGKENSAGPSRVAMLLENRLELLALYGACAYAGHTLFGINAGLRGKALAGVINQSGASLLVVEERFLDRIDELRDPLEHISPQNVLVVPGAQPSTLPAERLLEDCIAGEVAKAGESLEAPAVEVAPETNLIVIYTSGTTGLPKGINNSHFKMLAIGMAVAQRLELGPDDRGYACMPLYHSNALFLGFQPAMHAGGSLALRERFSASAFVPDVLRHGVTFWNYVGEPLHYILAAIEREYGGDEQRIRQEVTLNADNRFRYALGNGASPPDIDRFSKWLGLEDVFELYGSTEAAISTFRTKNDPRGSVGVVEDPAVQILNEHGEVCPPAEFDADGKIVNYAEAVGEICRVAADPGLFQGYFDNPDANAGKFRAGVYHSGDLGHIAETGGRRFLYFDGRTDDWIRKDGENFSAAQVARLLSEHADVVLAAAYGVPCAVSDELVMAALKLRSGTVFDPRAFFAFCDEQVRCAGMDRKWFPDFIRIVEDFQYTQTQKVLVRNLKRSHFDPDRVEADAIFWRRRGDDRYHPFAASDFEALRGEFARSERDRLLDL